MHLLYQGDGGPLDIVGISTFLSIAILIGAALGWVALIYMCSMLAPNATLRQRVAALESRCRALEDRGGG